MFVYIYKQIMFIKKGKTRQSSIGNKNNDDLGREMYTSWTIIWLYLFVVEVYYNIYNGKKKFKKTFEFKIK